jgi:hypothetical protein
MDNPEAYLGRLKPIHIFKGLKDEEILDFARELEVETHPADATIFEAGEEGQHFYIIQRGQVKVLRQVRGEQKQVATLVQGDYFGEAALLYGRRRSATIVAVTDVELLRLSKEDFDNLLKRYPQIKPNLLVEAESRVLYQGLNFNWLGPSEVVYLIARRHPLLLYQALALPVGLIVVLVLLALGALMTFDWRLALFLLALGGLPLAAWVWWVALDWGNDFYIVTNQRVVYLEKIIGIYDSRQEAPLWSVQAVTVETVGSLERALGIGNVIVRTFSGPITMRAVANPQALAALVEEHWNRTKTQRRQAEMESMKTAVRQRIGATQPESKPVQVMKTEVRSASLPARLSGYFSFKVRFEQGDSVIYRKHWYILLQQIWQPSFFTLLVLGLIGLKLSGVLPAEIPLTVVALVAFVLFIPFAGWWLYEYEDWRNDIYQVTPEQILDIDKKPFGTESRKAASLGNILSLKYERPGLLGMLLNYGDVVALVAGQEFRFEGVFDPVSVQNDVYRRIEAFKASQGQAEAARKRDEIAEWLGVYHTVLKEEEAKPPKPGG